MKTSPSILVLTALAGVLSLHAAEATLLIGDPAPKLQVAKWVQGEPVKEFAKDKAYIVEFWATWCGPCRASIPHLNEVYKKFKDKDLVVIGQDVWERDETLVKPFIEKMGDKMTYRVAMDDKSTREKGAMAETWMEAAGQNGIPAAFLVGKDGKIAWIGHPMSLEESTIQEVLDGKFDLAKAKADMAKEKESEGQMMKLSRDFGQAMKGKKWDDAEATLKEIEKILPESQRSGIANAKMEIFIGRGDLDGAAAMAETMSGKARDNAQMLNQLAWGLVSQENLKGKALEVAYKIAVSANEVSGGKDAGILDTLARATYMKGEKAKAVELQEQAVQAAEEESMKKSLKVTLESYREGKLPKAE